ncbi:hypothetical protein Goarm_022018, partial [Gossypium armourianum]|nr:hypothetical protein [Gossypium armourianum]
NLTALRELYIEECNNLVSLPQGLKFLATLENLAIVNCEKLDLTMEELELERKEDGSLRKLWIGGVPKLESLPQWILLGSTKTLQHLYIGELENWRMSQGYQRGSKISHPFKVYTLKIAQSCRLWQKGCNTSLHSKD